MTTFTYSDLDLTLGMHPGTKDVLKKYDVEAVKQSIKNIFFYNKFEKPFNANFGIGIKSYLFELISPAFSALLKRTILEQIHFYEPRAIIEELNIKSNPDSNAISVELKFFVSGNPSLQALNIVLERTR